MKDQTPFKNLNFVFTGQLEAMSRNAATDAVEQLGGSVSGRVTPDTTHVVVGNIPGRRAKHADILGAEILGEARWLAMLRDAGWKPE